MNKWQELARENFGAPYPLGHLNLYEQVILEELKYCDDQHEALRKLYALIDRIEHLTDVFNATVGNTAKAPRAVTGELNR